MSWLGLEGKTAVITGAGGGIGQALARAFAAEGARVVLLDRDEERTAPLVTELGHGAFTLACDLSKAGEIAAAAERVEAAGGADILVNNAGILRPGPLESVSEADWSAMLAVNLSAPFHTIQACAPAMLARAARAGVEMPITAAVAAVLAGKVDVKGAVERLMSRPRRQERAV